MTESDKVKSGEHTIISIRVINDPQYIEAVQAGIAKVAARFSMPENEINKLCLATEEAMVNIMNYAFSPGEEAYFDVSVRISGMDFLVVIHDKGKPFDFASLELTDDNYEGLGVKMMQALTDSLEFRNLGGAGREQRLIKHLVSLPEYQRREEVEVMNMPEQIDFDIHSLREEEALEVAQCIYDEFGYSYLSELIYYPKQFYEACQRGEIYSLVATAPNGEVAGHLALIMQKEFPGLAEMAIGVVKRKYRKYSMMKNMTLKLVDIAKNKFKLNALFAQAVTYHTFTQKTSISGGLHACGFAFHYMNNEEFTTTFGDESKRCNVACTMLPFVTYGQKIYVADEIRSIVEDVAGRMSLDREILAGNNPPEGDETIATLSINKRTLVAKYFVDHIGADFNEQVKLMIINSKHEKCVVIEIFLNLTDPGAVYGYDIAKNYNFFCTGMLPMSVKGDYLTMESILNDVIDYDSIKTIEPFTSLLERIRKLDPNEL